MSSNDKKSSDLKRLASIIRALINTRKPPCYLRNVLEEYRKVENGTFPHRNYGYRTAQELLEHTGEFLFKTSPHNGDVIISIKHSSNKSTHITNMVRNQKSKASRLNTMREEKMRQPRQQFTAYSLPTNRPNSRNNNSNSNNNNNNNYNKSNYQITKQQQQQQHHQSSQSLSSTSSSLRSQQTNRHLLNDDSKFSHHIMVGDDDGGSGGDAGVGAAVGNDIVAAAAAAAPTTAYIDADRRDLIDIRQSKEQYQQSNNIMNESLQLSQTTNYLRPILGALKTANKNQINDSAGGGGGGDGVFSKSQNRNTFNFRNMQNFNNNNNNHCSYNNNNNNKIQQGNLMQSKHVMTTKKESSIKALMEYCLTHKIPAPEYNVVTTKYPKLSYSCRVHVNNMIFSTYPIEYESENLAKEMCSKRALQKFIMQETKTQLPLSLFTDEEIKNRLLEELLRHPHGMFMKNIPEWFEGKFQQALPDNWYDLIQTSKQFVTEIGLNEKIIVFVNNDMERNTGDDTGPKRENGIKDNEQVTTPRSPLMLSLSDRLSVLSLQSPSVSSSTAVTAETTAVPVSVPITSIPKTAAISELPKMSSTSNSTFVSSKMSPSTPLFVSTSMSPSASPFVPTSLSPSAPAFVPTSSSSSVSSSVKPTVLTLQMPPPIRLPWTEKCWNIFITYCVSTVEIWGRLFGSDYSERFNNLMNDIEDYMILKKERPTSLVPGNIYLVCLSESWYRIRIDELNTTEDLALCYFIDFGDADWLEVTQVYKCESKFLTLAAQAVRFSLYGLEDFLDHPGARKPLDDLLLTKSVVGMIFSKEGDSNTAKIQVILFDTSTQEDINLNHQLVQLICEDVSLIPQIKADTINNVRITHICDNGDIYLQLTHNEHKYVQKVIEQIVTVRLKSNSDDDSNTITLKELTPSKLFLVCGGKKKSWYRGVFVADTFNYRDNTCSMLDVDSGETQDTTPLSQIYNLEKLSMALSKFPPLALKVALFNIPDVTWEIAEHIRSLLPEQCEALVKLNVQMSEKPSLVTIYRHLDGSPALCTINDIINIEYVLKKDEGKNEISSTTVRNNPNRKGVVANGIKRTEKIESSSPPITVNSTNSITRTDVDCGSNNTTLSAEAFDDLVKLKEFKEIPKVGEYFQVRVTLSATPSNFTIQPYAEYPRLRALMEELQEFCKTNNDQVPLEMIKVGEFYAAKNPDGLYHRAMVVKIYGDGDMIQVSFCDFGDTATLSNSQLKFLPNQFRQLPQMALQSRLYGIRAAKDDWTLEDCLYFRKLTVGQTFVSIIKQIVNERSADDKTICRILELELIDVSTDDDIFIHDLFLKENRAVKN